MQSNICICSYEFTDFNTMRTIIVSQCRNCGHTHNKNRKCVLKLFEYPVCNCINWAPMDNLKYLEWKAFEDKNK